MSEEQVVISREVLDEVYRVMEANKALYDKEVKAHRLTRERLELAEAEVDELKEELAEARAQFKVFYKVKEEAEREEAEAEARMRGEAECRPRRVGVKREWWKREEHDRECPGCGALESVGCEGWDIRHREEAEA
jgi:hypothetical protein